MDLRVYYDPFTSNIYCFSKDYRSDIENREFSRCYFQENFEFTRVCRIRSLSM